MNHSEIVNEIAAFVSKNKDIIAAFTIGSHARNEINEHSDIDVVIVSLTEPSQIFKDIEILLKKELVFRLAESANKQAYFISSNLIRTEVFVVKDPLEIKKLYKGSRIDNPNDGILMDKVNSLKEIFAKWGSEPKEGIKDLAEKELNKFLSSYESTAVALRKKDTFQAYYHYNQSLKRLLRLIQLERGDPSFIYLPRNAIEKLQICEKPKITELTGILNLDETKLKMVSLAKEFQKTHQMLYSKYPKISTPPIKASAFLKEIQARGF